MIARVLCVILQNLGDTMRVLILSCNIGEGHNSAAKAIKDSFDSHGVYCDIVDTLRFISRSASNIISKGHVKIYRYVPSLFNKGYKFSEDHPGVLSKRSSVNSFFNLGRSKLYRYIKDGEFDTIICTHPFTAMMYTSVKRKYGLCLKSCIVATDYTCSPGSTQNDVDYYFIPHESLIEDFVSKGAPKEKIVCSGIPVRSIFNSACSKEEAKEKLGIPKDLPHLVMMCGSMGCGPIEEISELLCKNVSSDFYLTVITGTNEKLYSSLEKDFWNAPNVNVRGFVRDIPLYLDSADIYMTKAGGISTSEAYFKGVPMAFIKAVAGCEDYNAAFFINMGAAITSDKVEDLVNKTLDVIKNKEKREEMASAIKAKNHKNAADVIFETLSN